MASVKTEGVSPIKRDPDMYEDEGKYLDDEGELQIPKTSEAAQVWLAKLPKWLWEAWEKIADDEEVEIGKLRIYDKRDDDRARSKMKMVLHDLPGGQHAKVPKKYDISLNKDIYNNTVIFSEKDQPGFKSWRPNRVFKKDEQRKQWNDNNRINKNKRYTSAIPKQVSLAGCVANEVTVTAVENAEYTHLRDERFREMFKPKRTVTFIKGEDIYMHDSMAAAQHFTNFTTGPSKTKTKGKKAMEKAVRISQEDLLDALNQCFKDFRYWSLRALKQRLHQPEAYIKSVIEKIATLIRSGPFAMQYRLNPEYERGLNIDNQKEEAAAVQEEEDEDDDDDDDMGADDDDFEDVKMEDG